MIGIVKVFVARSLNWRSLGLGLLVFVVVYLTLVPLAMILYGTFRDGPPGAKAAFTLVNYARAYGSLALFRSALNSVLFAVGAGAIAFSGGGYLAWVTERTDTPLKPAIYALVLIPFLVPGVLTTIAWVFLLSPQIGLLNKIFAFLFGRTEPLFDIYSFGGMIWTAGIDQITLPFLLMAAAFRSMDPSMEEAALVSGMKRWRTFFQIDMKLLLPSILAVWLLLFVRGIETFEAPAIIGIPAGIKVFATEIFLALRDAPTDYNLAATFATAYLAITIAGLAIYLRMTRLSQRFATITGRGYRPRPLDLGAWRFAALSAALVLLFTATVMPVAVILWMSFLPFYVSPSWAALSLFTVDNFRWLLDIDVFRRALQNNLIAGVSAATLAVCLSAAVAWITARTEIRGRKLLDALTFSPIAVPGIVMGLALLWIYLTLPIPLYGTLLLLIIGYTTKYIPVSLRAAHASLLQVDREVEDAARLASGSWMKNFVFILAPLIAPGLLAGWLYILTLSFKVLSLPILLSHVGTEVLPVVIFSLFESGDYNKLCALGVMLIVLVGAIGSGARLISSRLTVHAIQ